ncbi:MAG: arginine--tRNA ligase, partial [Planctomycetes bacterium]|nr:arginine--tRNA ligase [Planctomycetota bacterium]
RFQAALRPLMEPDAALLEMIRCSQDPRFGDYQANCAMSLAKRLGRPPRDIAQEIVKRLDVADLCEPPEIAGAGFINLRLRESCLAEQLARASRDERLSVPHVRQPRTFVVDYSSPNVAKPMHVGHIRSTVIGDAICRTLKFVGHTVIGDNHLGDWGTQFGMIIFGYRHFADEDRFAREPVRELSRVYQRVHRLLEYQAAREEIGRSEESVALLEGLLGQREAEVATRPDDKNLAKELRELRDRVEDAREKRAGTRARIAAVAHDADLLHFAEAHPGIEEEVLSETARLHAGDPENLALWNRFLPHCKQEIKRVYDRIDVRFDCELGESFYHDRLEAVVADLKRLDIARESEGADCVFLPEYDSPMLIRKKDGAFLYATTDLATIQYRAETWRPDAILYVVDHRQSEHFGKLFAAARRWGYADVELRHISFGTVLGEDGRPYRTRSGDVVDLEELLDEAIRRAYAVVCGNDDSKPGGPELTEEQRQTIARTVGHAALKYADLSHNRTSDYVFSFDKMVAMDGNTATYMQYSYARTQSIFARGAIDTRALRDRAPRLTCAEPEERDLAIELIR